MAPVAIKVVLSKYDALVNRSLVGHASRRGNPELAYENPYGDLPYLPVVTSAA